MSAYINVYCNINLVTRTCGAPVSLFETRLRLLEDDGAARWNDEHTSSWRIECSNGHLHFTSEDYVVDGWGGPDASTENPPLPSSGFLLHTLPHVRRGPR